ncbi:MAG: hypothetical protein JXR95_04915 [Deltaproteobacteria bacterium]|nr:hypothetical protein [Deltaproteobacteria bacterium]
MRTISVLFTITLIFSGCTDNKTSTPKKDPVPVNTGDTADDVKDIKVEKGPPPALPEWTLIPSKTASLGEVKSKVTNLSLAISDTKKIRIAPPYKIFQTGSLKEVNNIVIIPVRVEKDNIWLEGNLDMFQVQVKLPAGTTLRDTPKGVPVVFFADVADIIVKSVKDGWVQVSYEMNSKCSPSHLKGWLKKEDLMKESKGKVAFPWNFSKNLPDGTLPHTTPLFDIYSRSRGGESIVLLPLCKSTAQIIKVAKKIYGNKGRTKVFFKPSADSTVAVMGWIEKSAAKSSIKGDCTCKTDMPKENRVGKAELDMEYKTRTVLPVYSTPDVKTKPIGMLNPSPIRKYMKYYKNEKFAIIEIDEGTKLFVPFHDNYFYP